MYIPPMSIQKIDTRMPKTLVFISPTIHILSFPFCSALLTLDLDPDTLLSFSCWLSRVLSHFLSFRFRELRYMAIQWLRREIKDSINPSTGVCEEWLPGHVDRIRYRYRSRSNSTSKMSNADAFRLVLPSCRCVVFQRSVSS